MRKKKEVRYIFQTKKSDLVGIAKKKQESAIQGYLVITFIEGGQAVEKGLRNIIWNH